MPSLRIKRNLAMKVTKIVGASGLAAAAIIAAVVWLSPGDAGVQAAFADAVGQIKQARTFSCEQILEHGKEGARRTEKDILMFKEPDLARQELVDTPRGPQITICDYGTRRRLMLHPKIKEASLSNMSNEYKVDPKTGKVELTSLDVSLRDKLLSMPIRQPVEDLGQVELQGRKVRLVQCNRGQTLYRMWIDPHSRLPSQIEIAELPCNQKWTYASIQIDTPLDDKLFSVDPPEGYKLFREGLYATSAEHTGKMIAKMMYVGIQCAVFAANHGDRYPKNLGELMTGGPGDIALKRVLAAEEHPDGPPAMVYRPPIGTREPIGSAILLYEAHEGWPEQGVVVVFGDGHAESIADQERFERLMQGRSPTSSPGNR
jgi:outer membrane lipoprotein-sorting protein